MVGWAIIALSPSCLLGQATQPTLREFQTGFAQPAASNPPQAAPGIWRPPTHTAGTPVPASSTVAAATWTTPTVKAEHMPTSQPMANAERSTPFQPPTTNANSLKKPTSTWSSTISMVVSLLLVLAIFMGVAWFFRSVAPQPSRPLSKEVVQVLGRTPLAPRQQMVLIRFGRKLVLVSQQLGQTQTLSEIDDPGEVDHLLGLCEESNATSISNSFRDVLYQLANGKSGDRASVAAKKLSIVREA